MKRAQGFWADASVLDLESVLTPRLGIDPTEFAAWFAPRIERYRSEMKARELSAKPGEGLERIARDAPRLASALDTLSPQARALLGGAARNRRLRDDLTLLASQATQARDALRGSAGRKPAQPRDTLLAEVVHHLRSEGLPAVVARQTARDVLTECRVFAPADVKKAARKGQ